MCSLRNIFVFLFIGVVAVSSAAPSQANELERHIFLVVNGLENLKQLTRELSDTPGMNLTYHDHVFDPDRIATAIQPSAFLTLAPNSYLLTITMKDDISTSAALNFIERYTGAQAVHIAELVNPAIPGGRTKRQDVPYGSRVLDSFSTGLAIFSGGMAFTSTVPNPVTPVVAAGSGALSLGLGLLNEAIYG